MELNCGYEVIFTFKKGCLTTFENQIIKLLQQNSEKSSIYPSLEFSEDQKTSNRIVKVRICIELSEKETEKPEIVIPRVKSAAKGYLIKVLSSSPIFHGRKDQVKNILNMKEFVFKDYSFTLDPFEKLKE